MESYLQDQLLAQPMIKMRSLVLLLLGIALSMPLQAQEVDWRHLDERLSFEERTEILVAQLSTEEKIAQLVHEAPAIERLKVPAYNWWNEALHGVARSGYATVFPQSISVAASFDKELLHRIGSVTSYEARAKHHDFIRQNKRGIYTGLTFWSPNINIFRDPRWGRGHETYGEDPLTDGLISVCLYSRPTRQ